jgi:ribonucleotide monophosphatase NagD (HAD superfamily)
VAPRRSVVVAAKAVAQAAVAAAPTRRVRRAAAQNSIPTCSSAVVVANVEARKSARTGRTFATGIATNPDPTYPTRTGLLPGNGAIVAAVATAAGVAPVVAGKPEAPAARLARARFGDAGVMVGDRSSTDAAFAVALGWSFALVLSGVTAHDAGPGEEPVPDPAPAIMGADLAAIVDALLEVTAS